MNFQNPAALLWLLPLAGIIILLYLLRMRRRDVRVPATFLWPERTDEVRANALFQRLRFSWLLILQLLALTTVVFAFARPQTKQRGLAGEVTVLILDASASMGATDVGQSRFEVAKQAAATAIQSAKAGDRIAMIEAGPAPRVVFPLSNDPAKELAALDSVQLYDSEADIGAALRLAAALVGNLDSARIALLSDGTFEPVSNFSKGKASFVYEKIGAKAANMSISALGTANTPNGRQLYCAVRNWGLDKMAGTLTLYADGKLIDSEKISVADGKTYGRTIDAPITAKVFEAKLDAPDFLKADNYAVSLADPGASLRVLLVSRGDLFLERALSLDPRVTLDRADRLPTDGGSRYDIVVFDGVEEQPTKSRGVLTFGTAGTASPVTTSGRASDPTFVSAEQQPLMEGVDFEGTYIESVQKIQPKSYGQVLATTNKGPLIVASKRDQRQIYVAFEPMRSDFPLQVSFPIFIANSLDFLGGTSNSSLLAVRAGAPFSVAAATEATLTAPDGTKTSAKPNGATAVIRAARRAGVYKLAADKTNSTVYASLRSDRESNIDPVKDLVFGEAKVSATQAPARFADFWRPLVLLALCVLAGEWWLFARRS